MWDYPIKEQYTHILQVIKDTGPLENVDQGLEKVKIEKYFFFVTFNIVKV